MDTERRSTWKELEMSRTFGATTKPPVRLDPGMSGLDSQQKSLEHDPRKLTWRVGASEVLEVEAFPAKGFVNKGFVGPGGISEFTGMSWRAEDGGIPEGDELVE